MKRESKPTTDTQTTAPMDALARFRDFFAREDRSTHKPITPERAAEIADALLPFDNDVLAYMFIELLNGMMAAVYRKDSTPPSIDDLVLFGTIAAYKHTRHFEVSLAEFALLDWNNERDKRIIFGKITDEAEDES